MFPVLAYSFIYFLFAAALKNFQDSYEISWRAHRLSMMALCSIFACICHCWSSWDAAAHGFHRALSFRTNRSGGKDIWIPIVGFIRIEIRKAEISSEGITYQDECEDELSVAIEIIRLAEQWNHPIIVLFKKIHIFSSSAGVKERSVIIMHSRSFFCCWLSSLPDI